MTAYRETQRRAPSKHRARRVLSATATVIGVVAAIAGKVFAAKRNRFLSNSIRSAYEKGGATRSSAPQTRNTAVGSAQRPQSSALRRNAQWLKSFVLDIYRRIELHRLLLIAAGVTFYGLIAIFPATGALVSLYGLFADPASVSSQLQMLSGLLPQGAIEVIGDQAGRIASQSGGTLGIAFLTALFLSLWSANTGTKSMFQALNIIYDVREKRSFLRLVMESLAFTVGGIVLVLLAAASVVALPIILAFVPFLPAGELISVLRWPVLFVALALALAALYRFGPSRERYAWRYLITGSILAAVLWIGVSQLFSWYVSNFGAYNETYGSLGAVVGFMIWLWISCVIILVGAETDASLERSRHPEGDQN